MMNKNTQRIVVAILAIILAVIMILSLVAPAMAAEGEVAEDVQTEASIEETGEAGTDEAIPAEEVIDPAVEAVPAEEAVDQANEAAPAEETADQANEAAPTEEAAQATAEGTESAVIAESDSASDNNANISEAGTASEISLIATQSQVIPGGVKIGAVDVSGMNREQAEAAVNSHVAEMQNSVLTATADEQEMFIAVTDLGFAWTNQNVVDKALGLGCRGNILERYKVKKDLAVNGIELPIEREFSSEAMHSFISQCAATANRAPVENDLQMNDDGTLSVIDGVNGVQVDESASYSAMVLYMNTGWRGGAPEFALTTTVLTPQRDKEQLALHPVFI